MNAETTTNQSMPQRGAGESSGHTAAAGAATLHRICIQCNNVFCVTPDHYDAKHCPACRKE